MRKTDTLLGVAEVAERIGLKRQSVHVMSSRGKLPDPDVVVNKGRTKLWYTATIDKWNDNRHK